MGMNEHTPVVPSSMFHTVLVANRGEIAVRVIRTLQEMNIRSVAVYSDADAGALFVRLADESVRIGPAVASESYLNIPAVIAAALRTGAQAIHPGYGFLSENAEFARACASAGIVFIGPLVAAIEGMGDKIEAKTTVAAAGVPVVPGRHDRSMSDDEVRRAVIDVGLPALIKPAAGGGGKGMRVITDLAQLDESIDSARREATASFGNDALFVERYIAAPRHIEVQVVGDSQGNVIHLFERECSLQRRHQKVIEEAPSAFLDPSQREALCAAAVEVARACDYVGVGTVEFIVDGTDASAFYFLEMNTRLQVEHPVTEAITGVDLVQWQLLIAAGQPLPLQQDQVTKCGHAIEARVYAEDPSVGFLPSGGRLLQVNDTVTANSGLRVDTAVESGDLVGTDYDPMIAKLIAYGPDRGIALHRLQGFIQSVSYLGVTTNTGFLGRLLALPQVARAELHTGLIEENPQLAQPPEVSQDALMAVGLAAAMQLPPRTSATDPWDFGDGWRISEPAPLAFGLRGSGGQILTVEVVVAVAGLATLDMPSGSAKVRVDDGPWQDAQVSDDIAVALGDSVAWVAEGGQTWRQVIVDRLDAENSGAAGVVVGAVRSPMPGMVISVAARVGEPVVAGQPLVTVEAMKMEHTLSAPGDGVVDNVAVTPGSQVVMDQVLVTLRPPDTDESQTQTPDSA